MKEMIFMACMVALVIVPMIFVWHRIYEDGVFGRIGLSGIAFSASTYLLEWLWADSEYEMSWQLVLLVISFTLFLCWHLIRFHLRVVLKRPLPGLKQAR